jgi:CHAT domain-containing protein
MNLQQCSPFLSYLSTCGTGQIQDGKHVDKSTHLFRAFQLYGFRNVIGSLWEDEASMGIAKIAYKELDKGGITERSMT